MPLFFFHLRDAEGLSRDQDGLEYPDIEAAYLEACRAIPDMTAELQRKGRDPLRCAFVIADADDRDVMVVPFDELARRRRRWPAPVSSVITACERAMTLLTDVRGQHEALQANLARIRDLFDESRLSKR